MTALKGTNVAAVVVPFDTQDIYPTHDSFYGLGGYREVADATARAALPTTRLRAGCIVYQQSDLTYWQWNGTAFTSWDPEPTKSLQFRGGTPGRKPLDGETLFAVDMKTGDQFAAGATGWLLSCDTAPTINWTITFKKNGTSVGSGLIAASATTGSFTFTTTETFTDGDVFSALAISPQDAACSGVRYTLIGTRTQ